MIRGVYLNGMLDDCQPCYEIRKKVFKDELGCDVFRDTEDDMAIQILLYGEDEQPVASARLIFDIDGIYRFDYLAVLPEARKQGYADFIMHMIFDKARLCGAKSLCTYDIQHFPEYFNKYGFAFKHNCLMLDLNNYFNSHKCCQ